MDRTKSFNNWGNGRLHLNFPNGNHLSTIWASGSYSENYNLNIPFEEVYEGNKQVFIPTKSNTVEVMFDCGEKLHKKILKKYGGDSENGPIGHLGISEWSEILHLLATEKKV